MADLDGRCPHCVKDGVPSRTIAVRCRSCPWTGTAEVHDHPLAKKDDGISFALYNKDRCPACGRHPKVA